MVRRVRQQLGGQTEAAFGYRRHTDDFVLLRHNPGFMRITISMAHGRGRCGEQRICRRFVLLMGLEADGDSIDSYNFSGGVRSFALGIHARNRGAGYVDVDLRPAKNRWSLSFGAREEVFSGRAQAVFSPELAGSFRVAKSLRLRVSGGYGFRIPTYTDLYYSDPATLGNPKLKPESAWSGDAGADWTPSSKLMLSATGFYSRQHDTIDYVKSATVPNLLCRSVSGKHLVRGQPERADFVGVESTLTWIPKGNRR